MYINATSQALTSNVIDELKVHVRAPNVTKMYLQAVVWTLVHIVMTSMGHHQPS